MYESADTDAPRVGETRICLQAFWGMGSTKCQTILCYEAPTHSDTGSVGVRHASLEQKAMFLPHLAQVSAKHPQPVELEFEKAVPLGRALLRD